MSLIQYLKDTKAELKHVKWPDRRRTIFFTLVVIVVSVIVSAYLGVFDHVFSVALTSFISY